MNLQRTTKLWGRGYVGKRGMGECQRPARVSVLWDGGQGRTAGCFPCSPRWASSWVKPLTPYGGRDGGGQGAVPGSQSLASHAGYGRGAENRIGAPGRHSSPRRCGKRAEGERFPMQARVLKSGLDKQRQSMVLELYCRKAGEREKVERERDQPWPRGEKGEKEREKKG